jgi:hypothetical protein
MAKISEPEEPLELSDGDQAEEAAATIGLTAPAPLSIVTELLGR